MIRLIRPVGEPTRRDWIAVMSVMLGAFMAVLDIQITNSSLKDIQGALSATLEEGSWISTSYLVAEIIMIPLTAWLVQLLSARRLAVWVSLGFLVSSLLCSMAWSLESMIVFRAMQGFTGGALIPLAFTLTLIKLPEHHRAKGMAMFAMTATFAPSIGPTLGGWLTENWGWEYIFYINIPPGLVMIAGLMYGLEKKAAALGTAEKHRLRRHPHPWRRPRLSAGISRRRPSQGLARIEPDRDPGQHRPDQPDHLCDRAVFQAQSADQPRHPRQSQFRSVEHFQRRAWASGCTVRSICCRCIWRRSRATTRCRSAK